MQREAEIDAAEKTGEDVILIDEKYARKKQEIYGKYASDQVALIAENAAHEQEIRLSLIHILKRQVSTWNSMVEKNKQFVEWAMSNDCPFDVKITKNLLTPINAFNL